MADQTDNLMLDDDTTGLPRTINVASDDIVLSVNLTLQSGGVLTADNVKRGSGDPNGGGGTAGNEGDLYQRTGAGVGSLWYNTDGTATGWAQVVAIGGTGTGSDNHLVRWDGTVDIQDSGVILDDSDNMTGVASLALRDASVSRAVMDISSNDFRLRTYDTDGTTLRGTLTIDASSNPVVRWDGFLDLSLDSSSLITVGADSAGGADIRRRTATATAGGSLSIRGAATSLTNAAGGGANVLGGTGDGTGIGGSFLGSGGTGGASSGQGGLARTLGGSGGAPDGVGGTAQTRGGTGLGSGNGGPAFLTGGTAGVTGNGGAATAEGGPGGSTSGNGGSIIVRGGASTDGNGGAATITGGNAATTTAANRSGGAITITAGTSTGSSTGGALTASAGTGGATGAGGAVTISGGTGGSTSGVGGAVTVRAGLPIDGNGGALNLNGRDAATTSATNRNGGAVNIVAGNAVLAGTGGGVNITAGTSPSGSAGNIVANCAGAEVFRMSAATAWVRGASPSLILGEGTGSPNIRQCRAAANQFQRRFMVDGALDANRRWIEIFDTDSDIVWNRRDASGDSVDDTLRLDWATGLSTFGGNVSLSSAEATLTVGTGAAASTPDIIVNGGASTLLTPLLFQQGGSNAVRISVTSTGWLQIRRGDGTPVFDFDTATGGTTSTHNTVFSHTAGNADFRVGSGTGSPILRLLKSDAGALSVVYSLADTTTANRRWTHQFNSSENLTWSRYDGAGSIVDIPFQLNYSDGLATFGGSVTLGSDSPIFRIGVATGSPRVDYYKSDAGTFDVSYRSGGTSSSFQRWLHRFDASENIFWARYDASGVSVDTPLILSWTDGTATFAHAITVDDVEYTGTDGSAGQIFVTDGAGTTSWVDAPPLTDWKQSVRAATTANITLSGEQTIDGVAVITGDRVLVKNQSTTPTSISSGTTTGSSELVTDSNTFVNANCTSPPLATGSWFVLGHANFRNDGGSTWAAQIEARFGTTRIATASWLSIFGGFNVGDDAGGGAFQFFSRVTGNDSDTVNMRAQALDNGGGGSGENIRVGSQSLIYFSLDTLIENTDYWVAEAPNNDTAEVTPSGATWTDSEQLVFTPTETGDYLILASAEGFNTTGTPDDEYRARLRMNGVTIGTETEMKAAVTDTGGGVHQFGPSFTMIDVRSLTASTEYTINWQFQNAVGENQLSYRRSRIYVFRLSAFGDSASTAIYDGIQASNATVECTSDLTFDFGSAINTIVLAGCDYANAGSWGEGWLRHDGSPDVDYPPDGYMWAVIDGTLTTIGDFMPLTFGAWESSVSGSQTYRVVGHSDDTPILTFGRNRGNTGNSRMVLVALAMSAVGDSTVAPTNGIYTASSGAWTRSADANTSAEVTSMLTVAVEEGTVNGNTVWCLTTENPITLDSTSIGFGLLRGAASSLAATLAIGNTTGGTNVLFTSGSAILGENSAVANAGGLTLTAGSHNGGGASGFDGGSVTITAGDTDDSTGDGGHILVTAGQGGLIRGGIVLRAAGITTVPSAGSVTAIASEGDTSTGGSLTVGAGSNFGGSVALLAGDGVSGNTPGGAASVSAGMSTGVSNGGNLNLSGGEAQGSGNGGNVFLSAGGSDSGSPGTISVFGETFFFPGDPSAVHVNGSVVFTEYDNGNSGAAATLDWGASQKQLITLTASCTFTFTNPAGAGSFTLRVIQGGTGSYTITWPGGGSVLWPGGTIVQPTAAVGSETLYELYFNGTSYYTQAALDFQ